jgi:hypothetical protein
MPQFADRQNVGGIGRRLDGAEFIAAHAVVHHADEPVGRADLGRKGIARERAFEQEQLGTPHQESLGHAIDDSLRGPAAVMQRAAVRRIGANGAPRRCKARECAALRAVAVHDVRCRGCDATGNVPHRRGVAQAELALHRNAADAERELARQGHESFVGRRPATAGGDDADSMSSRRLALRQVEHMAEQPADRRA